MPGEPPHVAEMESFLAQRGERLLRTAIVLAGSRDAGEDLLQAALERLFRNWRKIRGDPEGYLRRILAHLATDGWRRSGRWRGRLGLLQADETGYLPDGTRDLQALTARSPFPPLHPAHREASRWAWLIQEL